MLSREDQQKSFFDPDQVCGNIIPEDSFYHTLNKFGPVIIDDEDFAVMYCEDNGRPSVPPSIMSKILLLQRFDNVSDREAAARAKFDIRWKHALGVEVHWEGVDASLLARFRAKLMTHGLEGVVFEKLNELASELGLIKADDLHAMDSSHILGAAQVKDTYGLIRDAMGKTVESLEEMGEQDVLEVFEEKRREKYREKEKADIDWNAPKQRKEQLQVLVGDACRLLDAIEEEEMEVDEVSEAAELLQKILVQDITFPEGEGPKQDRDGGGEEGEGGDEAGKKQEGQENRETDENPSPIEGEVKIKQGVSKARVVSVVDPQMRHGRKSSSHRFNGYKGHILENVQADWITATTTGEASGIDGSVGTEPLERQKETTGHRPREILADMAYGTADNRADHQEKGVELLSPVKKTNKRTGKYDKSDFEIDTEAGEVTCPAGKTTSRWVWSRDGKDRQVKRYEFGETRCGDCELRENCTTAKNGRTITLNYHEEKLQEDRAYQQTDEFEEKYRKRALCEPKIGEVMRRHGMRQARYFGKEKVDLQLTWTAAVVNLKRLPKLIEKKLKEGIKQAGSVWKRLKAKLSANLAPI